MAPRPPPRCECDAAVLSPPLLRSDWESFVDIFVGPPDAPWQFWLTSEGDLDIELLAILVTVVGWAIIFVVILLLARLAPEKLNYCTRMCILYFNVTYPLNAISSVFWIAIPPWICISGAFPFRFNPVFAILGSLILRLLEWAIVLRAKKEGQRVGTHLHEYSIFRSQQMNEVTVPIKLRACVLGFISGYKDAVLKHDNSFWISFGQAEAVVWVQAWLMICMLGMLAAFIGGIVNLILFWGDPKRGSQVLAATCFGMVLAAIQVWVLWEPAWYVMRGRKIKVSLRHTEVLVLLLIGIAVVLITDGNVGTFKAFQTG
jgi:hypothetical protein